MSLDVPIGRVDAVLVREALYRYAPFEDLDDETRAALARLGVRLCDALDGDADREFEFRVRVELVASDVGDQTSPWARIRTAGSSLPFSFPISHLSRRQRLAIALARTGFLSVEISAGETT